MLDANSIYYLSYGKKKSSNYIIPASHFNKSAALKPKQAQTKPVHQASPPAPKPVLKTIDPKRRRVSATSLKNLGVEKKAQLDLGETETKKDLPKDSFSNQALLEQWNSYTQFLHDDGQRSLSSVLAANKPNIQGTQLSLTLPNHLMAKQLERGMPGLMKHLRTKLNNFDLNLKVDIQEEVKKKFIYTPEEKYQRLTELNPKLKDLRQRFKLDL